MESSLEMVPTHAIQMSETAKYKPRFVQFIHIGIESGLYFVKKSNWYFLNDCVIINQDWWYPFGK